jgi:hypothetical protein
MFHVSLPHDLCHRPSPQFLWGPSLTPKGVEASNHLQYESVRPRLSNTFQPPVCGILCHTGPTTRQFWDLPRKSPLTGSEATKVHKVTELFERYCRIMRLRNSWVLQYLRNMCRYCRGGGLLQACPGWRPADRLGPATDGYAQALASARYFPASQLGAPRPLARR